LNSAKSLGAESSKFSSSKMSESPTRR
jgi:hypothetical protein